MVQIPKYEVRADVFDKILWEFSVHTEYVKDISVYAFGYKNRNTIYYNEEYLICKAYILDYYLDCFPDCPSWKQVWLKRVMDAPQPVQATISGSYAWNYMMSILDKYYTRDEVYAILAANTADYDEGLKQFHYDLPIGKGELVKLKDCFKYDINGAHADAVVSLFPKAKDDFLVMYKKRKEKPVYKQIFNFFVGELCRKGFRTTYNWIVQRTTKKLWGSMDTTNGMLVYANTDGYIVQDPMLKQNTSAELFDFKLEYEGDVYIYRSDNYILYQMGDELKGSCRCEVRNEVDLRIGKVIEYKIARIPLGEDANGKMRYSYEITNKQIKEVEIDEETYC